MEAGARAAGTLGTRLLDHREAIPPPISGSLPRHALAVVAEVPRSEKASSLYKVVAGRVSKTDRLYNNNNINNNQQHMLAQVSPSKTGPNT